MDRFLAMRVFVSVADAGGFASAAKKLFMSPPAVTRTINALEEHLGAPLFHRTTRHVRLTDAGIRFLEDCRRILLDLDEAEESVAGAHRAVRGKLAVTASTCFGSMYVAPLIMDFLESFPEVSVQTLFVDRVVNLIDEGLDVAIRIGELPDSSLTAIRVGSVRRVICAAPGYLDSHGLPLVPEDIRQHEIVQFSSLSPRPEWQFKQQDQLVNVPFSSRLTVNTTSVALAAALAGRGLTMLLSYMVAAEVESGRLQVVLSDFENDAQPIHIVYQEGRKAAARVRAFVDFVGERLRAQTRQLN